jgi:hypothetical protein
VANLGGGLNQDKMKIHKIKSKIKEHFGATLITAFGIVAALAWKDVLSEYLTGIVTLSPVQSKLVTALIVTFISLVAIITIAHITNSKK